MADIVAIAGEVDPAEGAGLWLVPDDGASPRPLTHLRHHSDGGMAWGYVGNGPADAALSILATVTGDRAEAERLHSEFLGDVVAQLPLDRGFRLEVEAVRAWVRAHPAARASPAGEEAQVASKEPSAPAERPITARSLAERERLVAAREARVDAMAVTVGLVVVQRQADSLPAAPVREQLVALAVDDGVSVESVAATRGLDPTWAAGVASGAQTTVGLDRLGSVCTALECTPYDLWGTEAARSVVHAYGPDAWPSVTRPLLGGEADFAPPVPVAPSPSIALEAKRPDLGLDVLP